MDIVCLDTHILIWGVQKNASSESEHRIAQAETFLNHLQDNGTHVVVPSIVVAELLTHVPAQSHSQVTDFMNRNFIVAPFDIHASAYYAKIWQDHSKQKRAQIRQENGLTRKEMKADFMIVAIAVARDAQCIYSYDGGLKAFAKGHIEVKEMPVILKQDNFLEGDNDI